MPNTIADETVVIVLVMISGQLPNIRPWITKKMLPKASRRNVGIAIPSVSRVRIVWIA